MDLFNSRNKPWAIASIAGGVLLAGYALATLRPQPDPIGVWGSLEGDYIEFAGEGRGRYIVPSRYGEMGFSWSHKGRNITIEWDYPAWSTYHEKAMTTEGAAVEGDKIHYRGRYFYRSS